MYYGIDVPNYGAYADPHVLVGLARDAEDAGWDGFFLWDHVAWGLEYLPMADPWVILAAIAMSTKRLRLGTMVTPLPLRRPVKLARETVTLYHLSGGLLVLGVGIGSLRFIEWDDLGEEPDLKVRAAMLDEGLEVLSGLWSGEPFSHRGSHHEISQQLFLPKPLQSPRIPVWVAGRWLAKAPFRRAARWDGAYPIGRDLSFGEMMTPEEVRDLSGFVRDIRGNGGPFDLVHAGLTGGEDPDRDAEVASRYADAGATWWMEHLTPWRYGHDERGNWTREIVDRMAQRIRSGPPKAP